MATTVADVKTVELSAKMFREIAEANADNVTPVETAAALRVAAALEAAEKMADAIDAAEDSRYSMTPAAKAAWEFRKAMWGEL